VSFHGTDLTVSAREPAWAGYYALMLATAARVTVVSRFLEDRLRDLGGYDGPIHIVPSGVRLGQFPFMGGPRPGSAPRLLFVGRLIECKGVDVLLASLAKLRTGGLDATLRVVGDGPLRAALETLAASHRLPGVVEFLGTLSHSDVRRELAGADIVVVPSRIMANGQTEGSSVVSKEAQATGVPLVATHVGGIPETVRPELRDELVAPDDPVALAAGISRVWEERDGWGRRVRAQREWIAAEFAWDRIGARLSGVYDEVLAYRPPERARARRLVDAVSR
jgi:colanic acid/amylovoran biosynthesis glycosyltransferase